MVWNYTSTMVKSWWARATGETTASGAASPYGLQSLRDWWMSHANNPEPTSTLELQEIPKDKEGENDEENPKDDEPDQEKGKEVLIVD
jgi:hypothetical protein